MGHDAHFLLLKKEKAKNSFEARKLVLWTLEEELEKAILAEKDYEVNIGGDFSGLLSEACGGRITTPYYNDDMRKTVREKILVSIPWIKENIEKSTTKEASILAKDLKASKPEFIKYTDSDLLDALRLELYSMGINVELSWQKNTGDIIYTFDYKVVGPHWFEETWKGGRYDYAELGYEDDAMIVNECLYKDVIESGEGIIIDMEKEDITPENTIGKKWIVLVDKF